MKKTSRDQLPGKNVSRKELAKFWDTHSIADYMDVLKPVRVRVAKNLSQGITIRLDPMILETLRKQAHAKGIGPTTLIRMWIHERIALSASHSPRV